MLLCRVVGAELLASGCDIIAHTVIPLTRYAADRISTQDVARPGEPRSTSKHDYGSHVTHVRRWIAWHSRWIVLDDACVAVSFPFGCCMLPIVISLAAPWLRWPLQPPHTANRHDAGCGGAGADRVVAVMRSGGFILRGTNMDYQDPGEKPCGPYQGMTVNERLFAAGQFEAFEKAATNRDEDAMVSILMAVDITKLHAKRIAGEIIENPKQFGY